MLKKVSQPEQLLPNKPKAAKQTKKQNLKHNLQKALDAFLFNNNQRKKSAKTSLFGEIL